MALADAASTPTASPVELIAGAASAGSISIVAVISKDNETLIDTTTADLDSDSDSAITALPIITRRITMRRQVITMGRTIIPTPVTAVHPGTTISTDIFTTTRAATDLKVFTCRSLRLELL